jgi:hypothetical protein
MSQPTLLLPILRAAIGPSPSASSIPLEHNSAVIKKTLCEVLEQYVADKSMSPNAIFGKWIRGDSTLLSAAGVRGIDTYFASDVFGSYLARLSPEEALGSLAESAWVEVSRPFLPNAISLAEEENVRFFESKITLPVFPGFLPTSSPGWYEGNDKVVATIRPHQNGSIVTVDRRDIPDVICQAYLYLGVTTTSADDSSTTIKYASFGTIPQWVSPMSSASGEGFTARPFWRSPRGNFLVSAETAPVTTRVPHLPCRAKEARNHGFEFVLVEDSSSYNLAP